MSKQAFHAVRPTRQPVQRPPLAQMAPDELRIWLQHTQAALKQKMQRERSYLDRRATRGVYTVTDDAYKQEQLLEADLLALLDGIAASMAEVLPCWRS